MKLLINILRIYYYSIFGLLNQYREIPPKTIIIIHGSWIGENSESFLHAKLVSKIYNKNKYKISYIVASGYDANIDTYETEGEYINRILIDNGVPRNILITEKQALTTTENIIRSINLIKDKGLNIDDFNIIPVHRPSYIWKTYYLWNMLGYKIYMAIASREPVLNFNKNIKDKYKNINNFFENPIQNEINTATIRQKTRTKLNIQPLTEKEITQFINIK